jgi:hypothetical protein
MQFICFTKWLALTLKQAQPFRAARMYAILLEVECSLVWMCGLAGLNFPNGNDHTIV